MQHSSYNEKLEEKHKENYNNVINPIDMVSEQVGTAPKPVKWYINNI